jgi:O-succinylbenzoic acid--CoA ligase
VSSQREVRLLEVEPGPAGVAAVLAALPAALAGDGPALGIAPAGTGEYAVRAQSAVLGRTPAPGGTDQSRGAGVDADVAVVLATSGSTGAPKGVLLPASALLTAAHAMHQRFGGPAAWLLALPVTGIGGLQVLVRALVGQCDPVVLSSVGGAGSFDPAEFADATWRLDPSLPAWTSLVPAQAARLLEHPEGLAAMRAYEMVLLGGARTPPALLDRLRAESVAAVTSYGMTETCGGAYYEGTPLPGVAATILSPDAEGVGRIAIGGPTVARGYLGDATATAAGFVDGRVVTADLGRLSADGGLEVLGRVDDVVQVGGVNVAVSAVEDALRSVCADACVLVVADEAWGSRLTAYVVDAPSDDELADVVARALGTAAVPRTWVRLDAIPHLPTGKPDRTALAALSS